jgi:hypothetical protein
MTYLINGPYIAYTHAQNAASRFFAAKMERTS